MLSTYLSGTVVLLQGGGLGFLPTIIILGVLVGVILVVQRLYKRPMLVEVGDVPTDLSAIRRDVALMKRYKDAYIVAKVTNGFGDIIKAIGIIIGVLLLLIGISVANDHGPGDPMRALGIVGIIFGIVIGAWFYIVGVLVSAQGQILKATLDSAVNGSPFLTDEERAKIMSLPNP
jgi:hypothetical protein